MQPLYTLNWNSTLLDGYLFYFASNQLFISHLFCSLQSHLLILLWQICGYFFQTRRFERHGTFTEQVIHLFQCLAPCLGT